MIQGSLVNDDILSNTINHDTYKFGDWVTLTKLEEDSQSSVSVQDSSVNNTLNYIFPDYSKEEEFCKFLKQVKCFYYKLDKLIKLEKQYKLTKEDVQQIEETKKYLVDNVYLATKKIIISIKEAKQDRGFSEKCDNYTGSLENKKQKLSYYTYFLTYLKIVLYNIVAKPLFIANSKFVKNIKQDIELPKLTKDEIELAEQDKNNTINKALEGINMAYTKLLKEMDDNIQSINKTDKKSSLV